MNKKWRIFMIKRFLLCIFIGIYLVFGCFADDLPTNNKEIDIAEIDFSDYAIKKIDTGTFCSLFDNIYEKDFIEILEPVVLYEDAEDHYYSVLAQTWDELYIAWSKGDGTILKIIVGGKGYETKRGIGIGSSISDIDKAYGKNNGYRNEHEIEFDLGSEEYETMMGLRFYLVDEIVVKIEILQGN